MSNLTALGRSKFPSRGAVESHLDKLSSTYTSRIDYHQFWMLLDSTHLLGVSGGLSSEERAGAGVEMFELTRMW